MVAAAVVGGAVVGAVGSSIAGSKAAGAQEDAANKSVGEQRREYNQTRTDYAPWRDAGAAALGRLNTASTGDNSNFFTSPGYEFTRSEGDRGIQQSAAAQGGLYSGNALKALSAYNGNLAAGQYNNWWNQQAGLAGVGQSATAGTAAAGQASANNISNAYQASGDARASGILGTANGISGSVNSGIQNYLGYQNYLKNPGFSSYGGGYGGSYSGGTPTGWSTDQLGLGIH